MNEQGSSSVIVARNLRHKYGAHEVLRGIDFELEKGEFAVLKGPNGSGKTTLLRIIATLMKPTSGDVFINGSSLLKKTDSTRKLIGFVPSTDGGFVPSLTGRENLFLFAHLSGKDRGSIGAEIDYFMEWPAFRLALSTPFQNCSAGMKQSLHWARVAIKDPPVLILDEPTQHLDKTSVEYLSRVAFEKFKSKTVLFSSHLDDAFTVKAHRHFTLKSGQLQ